MVAGALSLTFSRRNQKESQEDDGTESDIRNRKNPGGKIIVDQQPDYSSHKSDIPFHPLPRKPAQAVFPLRYGTYHPDQGFEHYDNDRDEMDDSKRVISDPGPSEESARDDHHLPAHREQHVEEMKEDNRIRQ